MAKDQVKSLLKQYAKLWRRSVKPVLETLPEYQADWFHESKHQLNVISQDLPVLKDTPPSLRFALVGAINMMAVYKVLRTRGFVMADIKTMSDQILDNEFARIPKLIRRLSGWFMFTGTAGKMTQRYADDLVDAPANQFRMDYEKRGETSFALNITQCAICSLAAEHDCRECVPMICKVDSKLSEAMNWGLTRTQTIAGGAKYCDFVFTKGAVTNVIE